jgi:hypothetical protein
MLLPILLEEDMDAALNIKVQAEKQITIEEVNRLIDIGRLLFSVLTTEEIEELQTVFSNQKEIGNTGDS